MDSTIAEKNKAASESEVYAFPTTVGQKRFWALNNLAPGNPALNMPLAARLQGKLDRTKFQAALDEVIRRHEILRSSFQAEGEDVIQLVHPHSHRAIHWIERPSSTAEAVTAATRELMQAEALKTLDLAQHSQLRTVVASFADEEHLLMLTMHHIVCDGWSNGVLLREIATGYSRLFEQNPVAVDELPLQYGDYAVWQKGWLQGSEAKAQVEYWRAHLGEELPVLNLPTDRPRHARPTFNGHIHTLLLPQEIADGIRILCQRERVTPFMLHLSAYVLLLYRYADRREFVIGSPAANRNQTELESLIGLFANPLLFRFKIDPAISFRQLLEQVRDLSLANFARQEYPFELIGEDLRGERSHRGVPWLQAYFIFQKAFMQPQEMPGLHLTPLRSASAGAMFEWMLGVLERNEGVRLQLEYNTDLFDVATVDRALQHLQAIMAAAINDPNFIIGDLDLNASEPAGFAAPTLSMGSAPISLLARVATAFSANAQATVLIAQNVRLTLTELQHHTESLCSLLPKALPGKNLRIALSTEDTVLALTGSLAICEAGHTAVLLPVVLIAGNFDAILSGTISKPGFSSILRTAELAGEEPGLVLQNDFSSDRTGRFLPVTTLCDHAKAVATRLKIRPSDRVLVTAQFHTLLGWEELLASWLSGATAVIDADCDRAPSCGVSVLLLPSAWWEEMLRRNGSPWPEICARARLIALDRDPVAPAALKAVVGRKARVVQRFQPQAIGCTVAFQTLRPSTGNDAAANVQAPAIWIDGWTGQTVDSRGIVTPRPIPGHMKVESAYRGFSPSTTSPDWVRERNDGSLEWISQGRAEGDAFGYDLESKEITDIAAQHPSIWSSCVVRRTENSTVNWVLHVVAIVDAGVSAEGLTSFLAERLPSYMVPIAIVVHARMPLTASGKIDYDILREPRWMNAKPSTLQDGAPGTAESESARDEIETKLAALLAEMLHLQRVDVRRSFFDLGGHSLLGVKLFARIEKEFHKRLPLATLLTASSVRALAQRLQDKHSNTGSWSCLVPIQDQGTGPIFFCVHGAGGNVLLYRELARHMAPGVRFYGLQAQGLDGRSPSQTKIEDMAELYLREILAVQPQGPYFIGGYCMGGNIAYEIAQLLGRQGKAVGLVAMLDTFNLRQSRYSSSALARFRIWLQKSGFHLNTLAHLSMAERKVYVAEKLRMATELLQGKCRAWFSRQPTPSEAEEAGGRIVTFVQKANHIALTRHDPQPFSGNVALFRPRKNYYTFRDPKMGWGDLVQGRLESIVVTANPHAMLIEPFVKKLAGELSQRMIDVPTADESATLNRS